MKSKLGGKHANNKINSANQKTRGKEGKNSGYDSVTYTFYDPKLGMAQITGRNRREVLKKARQRGYTESDLREY